VAVARPGYVVDAVEDGETSGLKHDTVARLDTVTNVRERDLETSATTYNDKWRIAAMLLCSPLYNSQAFMINTFGFGGYNAQSSNCVENGCRRQATNPLDTRMSGST
jgi:hypothetical protein